VFLAEILVVAIVTGPYAGPKADIAALTATVARTPGSHISGAHVVGDYALVQWYGAHAGQPEIYKRVSAEQWKMIMTGGGGPMFLSNMLKGGIPKPVALELCSGWPKSFGICDLSQ
jgi:hypothetical protein